MKKILYSICIGTLAFALTAWGEQVQDTTSAKTKAKARSAASVQRAGTGGTVRSSAAVRTRGSVSAERAERFHPRTSATVRERDTTNVRTSRVRARNEVAINREQNLRVNRERSAAVARDRNVAMSRQRNAAVARERDAALARERNLAFTRDRNASRNARVTNNWQGTRFSGRSYAAFRNYHRQWHDRGWWTSHHSRIVFYFGAPYYWDAGYWYPAWGYYPGYTYQYDGPIYGYNDLSPDQVVVDVQAQLQRDGYYSGPIDGVLGPMTREAIAAFQADHGLAITSAVDEPTLASLGLA